MDRAALKHGHRGKSHAPTLRAPKKEINPHELVNTTTPFPFPRNRLKASYVDYIRFAPDGADSIYVTLGVFTWTIHAEIDWDVGFPGYKYITDSTPDPTAPDGSDGFQTWKLSYQP
jgi:hypothetical protein